MKTKYLNAALMCLVVLFSTVRVDAQVSAVRKDRVVAVTFDDLPVISLRHDLASQTIITRKLLHAIKSNRVPAIGFVNENKLLTDGTLDERRVGSCECGSVQVSNSVTTLSRIQIFIARRSMFLSRM